MSILPVMVTESKVRYAATTPSKAPLLHSSTNSSRLVELGATRSAISERASNSFLALSTVWSVAVTYMWCVRQILTSPLLQVAEPWALPFRQTGKETQQILQLRVEGICASFVGLMVRYCCTAEPMFGSLAKKVTMIDKLLTGQWLEVRVFKIYCCFTLRAAARSAGMCTGERESEEIALVWNKIY
jgi:hypothetical protein